MKEAD